MKTHKTAKKKQRRLDNCKVCKGAHGGVRGNENIICGVVICDYCSVACFGDSQRAVDCKAALQQGNLARALELVHDYQQEARARRLAHEASGQ